MLDHGQQQFVYTTEGVSYAEKTPYGILRCLARMDLIKDSLPSRNWAHLWFTLDDGANYICGDELRRYHAAYFSKPLVPVNHNLLPKA